MYPCVFDMPPPEEKKKKKKNIVLNAHKTLHKYMSNPAKKRFPCDKTTGFAHNGGIIR